jgi:capsular polysaccharide biosynthesis protein
VTAAWGGITGAVQQELRPQPYVSPGRSMRNHWRLVVGVVAAALVCALAAGLVRSPTYTAEARLVVGKTVQLSNLAAIPGLAAAGEQLASDYSRLVSTGSVVQDAAQRLGRSNGLGGSLSASPVPQSPVVRIEGSAASSEQAVRIANAGSVALVHAVNTLNEKQTKAGESLLQQYRVADEQLLRDQESLATLQSQLNAASTSAAPPIREQVLAAQTAVDADRVRLNALADDYGGSYSPSQLDQQVIQRVGGASPTGSDRMRVLEIFLLVAAIAALVIGIALAAAVDLRGRMTARR